MSSRQLKKVGLQPDQTQQLSKDADDDESDASINTAAPAAPRSNLFALLSDEAEGAPAAGGGAATGGKKKKKKKKPTGDGAPEAANAIATPPTAPMTGGGRGKGAGKKQPQVAAAAEVDEVDQALAELGLAAPSAPAPAPAGAAVDAPLYECTVRYLCPDTELKENFGQRTIDAERGTGGGGGRGGRRPRSVLVGGGGAAGLAAPGLRMEALGAGGGAEQRFEYRSSGAYALAGQAHGAAAASGDPHRLAGVLDAFPWHVPTLLQLAELFKTTGDFARAAELLGRALAVLEAAWHPSFLALAAAGRARLSYACADNRPLLDALFRWAQLAARQSCHRTALELCKLVLALEPADPLHVLLVLDHFALRARHFELVYALAATHARRHLPSLAFSAALARFHEQAGRAPADQGRHPAAAAPLRACSADQLLDRALAAHPAVLQPLLRRCGLDRLPPAAAAAPFAGGAEQPLLRSHVATIFVERNFGLWKPADVQAWLLQAAARVAARPAAELEAAAGPARAHWAAAGGSTGELDLAAYTDALNTLPPGMEVFAREQPADAFELLQQAPPVVHAPVQNPLGLFLHSLMPWAPLPNAPAVAAQQPAQQPQQAGGVQQQQLLQVLAGMLGLGNAPAPPPTDDEAEDAPDAPRP